MRRLVALVLAAGAVALSGAADGRAAYVDTAIETRVEGPDLPDLPDLPEPHQVVVTGPSSASYRHAPPVLAVPVGGAVTLHNVDPLDRHDLVHLLAPGEVGGPDDQPWCESGNFLAGRCPVFWTRLLSFNQTSLVLGFENLEPGRQYAFVCTIHPAMTGVLVGLPGED